jgi:hypothetical protein
MSVKSKEILEHFESEEKNRDEVSGLMDHLAENFAEEIELLGQNKQDRLERHAALGKRIAEEIDRQADILIRRQDIVKDIKAKFNGSHPEPIVLNLKPTDVVFLTDKRPGRGLFGRKAARTVA